MKGAIQEGHIPVNNFVLLVLGMVPFTLTKLSGIEKELEVVDLPDRTKASGGQTKAGTFTMMLPLHHTLEVAAMQKWFKDSQDPVQPGYRKTATLTMSPVVLNEVGKSYTILGLFPVKEKLPDLEMKNEGEMAEVEYTMAWTDIDPQ